VDFIKGWKEGYHWGCCVVVLEEDASCVLGSAEVLDLCEFCPSSPLCDSSDSCNWEKQFHIEF